MKNKGWQMTVSIIGSGNIAWHLVNVFEEKGVRVAEVFGRDKKKVEAITGYLYDVKVKTDLDFSNSPSDIFILAVSDDAIEAVASQVILPPNKLLIHTSGARDMNVLLKASYTNPNVKVGVLYPLMTFTRGLKVNFREVPVCLEAEDKSTQDILSDLASRISDKIYFVNSIQRSVLHVGAVFSCNFTNHLLALGKEILEDSELDFDLLKPLINETFKKGMKANHPAEVQTGPAIRDDFSTIDKHREILKEDEDLLEVYNVLTKSIQDWYQ